jgi:hypothetical protein
VGGKIFLILEYSYKKECVFMDSSDSVAYLEGIEQALEKSAEKFSNTTYSIDFSHVDHHLLEDKTISAFTSRIIVDGYEYGAGIPVNIATKVTFDEIAAYLIGRGVEQYLCQMSNDR